MNKKLVFAIEDASIIEEPEDSQFATARISAFNTGKSLHDTLCDVETLKRTAPTIYEKPIIFSYDPVLDDFYTHTDHPINAGFVIPNSAEFEQLSDGRTSLVVLAKIWKAYSGKFLEIFRDTNKTSKSVSVEMEIINSEETSNGLLNLLDFAYAAICVLGDFVTPASPGSNIEMLSFAKDENKKYNEAYIKEFAKYDDVDFTIPQSVQDNCKEALSLFEDVENNGKVYANPLALAAARHLSRNDKSTLDKVKNLIKRKPKNVDESDIVYLMWGGKEGFDWLETMSNKIKEIDDKRSSYFSEDKEKEEMSMTDKEKQEAEDAKKLAMAAKDKEGSPTEEKKETPDEEKKEDADKTEGKKEDMAAELPVADMSAKDPDNDGDDDSTPEGDTDHDNGDGTGKKFSNNVYTDVPVALAFLEATDMSDQEMLAEYGDQIQMAVSELKKDDQQFDFAKVFSGLCAYAKMCNAKMAKMDADGAAYMAENAELKKFKADYDAKQKEFAVSDTIKTLAAKFAIPQATVDDMVAEAEKVDFANIDSWKNSVKAKCVDFAVINDSTEPKETFLRMGMPFNAKSLPAKNDIWAQ